MKRKRAALYIRVSTQDQHPEMQERELIEYIERRNWTLAGIYRDKGVSGARANRPGLDSLLADCKRRKFEILAVWKFDRFARSLNQLTNALSLFRKLGIDFVSCTEALDTSLPHGELVFQIFGAIAQWERSLIAERVRAGLQHARAKGVRLGRPPNRRLTDEEIEQMRRERHRKRVPFRLLARRFGVSLWTAHTICAKQR